ncbi:MAG: quinon protein alcohol dehydrogenase-like superfamily [Monoraphidium minutum]|nr:MAG: quinon protein alcohol dehydrogenase-like superfamily [Monoraphidium minutum]
MRFRVEVELADSEIPVATELLQVIRLLTEHVKGSQLVINGVASSSGSALDAGAAPVAAAAPPAGAAPPAAPPAALPFKDQVRSVLMRVTPDGSNAEQVGAELASVLAGAYAAGGEEFMRALPEEFTEAFTGAAFDPALLAARRGSAAFVRVLAALPSEPYGKAVAPLVVRKTLGQVTKKRAEDAPRESFTLQAEAFATLAALGLVANFDGALTSMERVLRKPECRAAALDTLCYFVQHAEAKVAASKREVVQSLLSAVESVADSRSANEVQFLRSKLYPLAGGGAPAAAAPAAGPPVPVPVPAAAPQQQQGPPVPVPVPVPVPAPATSGAAGGAPAAVPASAQLVARQSLPMAAAPAGEGAEPPSVFSLCYDASKQQLIAGGKDTPLTVMGPNGEILQQFPHPNLFVCAADTFPQHHMALAAMSSARDSGTPCSIAIYNTNPWSARATISRTGIEMLACLRCLPGSNTFVTGESLKGAPGQPSAGEVVCMYDLGSALQAGVNAQPLRTWREHQDLVSCVSPVPGQPHIFVSGSRDQCIKLWDTRMEHSAGALVAAAAGGSAAAHNHMVTCIDAAASEPLLVSSSLEGVVSAWDLRRMGGQPVTQPVMSVQVDGNAVLKVALSDSPYQRLAAIATTLGVYALDLQPSGEDLTVTRVITASLAGDLTSRQMNDIRWGRFQGQPALFGACSQQLRVDVLSLVA